MMEVDSKGATEAGPDEWQAVWSGCYPCLCEGFWTLLRNGKPIKTDIPFQEGPAGTLGAYWSWHFEDWEEVFEEYEDGLDCDTWCRAHAEWLASIAPEDEWPQIFAAFRTEDFRPGSCGGCI